MRAHPRIPRFPVATSRSPRRRIPDTRKQRDLDIPDGWRRVPSSGLKRTTAIRSSEPGDARCSPCSRPVAGPGGRDRVVRHLGGARGAGSVALRDSRRLRPSSNHQQHRPGHTRAAVGRTEAGPEPRSSGGRHSLMRAAHLPCTAPTGGAAEPLDCGSGLRMGGHHVLLIYPPKTPGPPRRLMGWPRCESKPSRTDTDKARGFTS